MSQHFLMSAAARSLSIGKVMRMSDQGAENVFARLRWPTTDGKPGISAAFDRGPTIIGVCVNRRGVKTPIGRGHAHKQLILQS